MTPEIDREALLGALEASLAARAELLPALEAEGTTICRLLHGAAEGLSGLTADRYGPVLLVQTWREPLAEGALEAAAELATSRLRALGVALEAPLVGVWNHRARGRGQPRYAAFHPADAPEAEGRELGLRYDVRPRHRGKDPLLFVDFRSARRAVRAAAEGKEVLNLYAYTCGIGVAAAAGGAREVLNVDFARSALEVGRDNAARNGLSGRFKTLQADCLPASRLLAGLPVRGRRGRKARPPQVAARSFDLTVLDPPRWATSAFGTVDVKGDYPSLFKPAVLATREGGAVLATNNLASVAWEDWVEVLERCAAKAGRPLRSVRRILPEADVPSFDGQPPLKLAWCEV